MKKNLVVVLSIIVIFSISVVFFSCESNDGRLVQGGGDLKANSKVLVELFTNTSCTGCPEPGKYLDSIFAIRGVTINDTNVVIIRYHTSLFPNDPFHLFNVPDNIARQTYYSAGQINPLGFLCGSYLPLPYNQSTWTTSINQRLNQVNSFAIGVVSHSLDSIARTVGLNLTIGQISGNQISDLKLFIVLTESKMYYTANNGERDFENVMRQIFTSSAGDDIGINTGQSINVNKNYTINNGIWISNCEVIVFVQSQSTKEIYGVEKIKLGN